MMRRLATNSSSVSQAARLGRGRGKASAMYQSLRGLAGSPEDIEKNFIMPTYAAGGVRMKEGLVFEKGSGSRIYGEDGSEFVDMGAGIAVTVLGHADKDIQAAVNDQMGKVAHASNLYHTRPSLELAEKLVKSAPGMGKVFFCNSGTEANEGAIKFARVVQNSRGEGLRDRLIGFKQSFHGRTLGALSVTYKPGIREPFKPLLIPNVDHIEFNNIAELEKTIGSDVMAVIVEPVQGEGGITPASREFLQRARELCDEHGVLLIFDEVQIGLGRQGNGRVWGYEEYGVVPDIMTMAKPLANGLPIGAVMVAAKTYDAVEPAKWLGTHGSTFAGNPVATRAANVVLDKVLKPGFLESVAENGRYMIKGLDAIKERVGNRVLAVRRPLGDAALYAGLQLPSPKVPDVIKHCLNKNVLVLGAGDTGMVVRLCPPLVISKEELDIALEAIEDAIMTCVPEPTDEEVKALIPKIQGADDAAAEGKKFVVEMPTALELASKSVEEYEKKLVDLEHTKLPEGFQVGITSFQFQPEELPESANPATMKLTVIRPDEPTSMYGAMFTQNAFPGAPIRVCREILSKREPLGALVINNKISNVHPRAGGVSDARAVCKRTAELLGLQEGAAVMPSSTGVIGWRLPVKSMIDALPGAVEKMQSESILPAAKAIMTTDTFPKSRSAVIRDPSTGTVLGRVTGIAKGAGMIEPNMATMLVYVMTDITAEGQVLQDCLKEAVNAEGSFNRISVDADQSTSDSIVLLSSGKRPALDKSFERSALTAAVRAVCADLAQDVVRNGEGTEHVMKCTVEGAPSAKLAHGIAKCVVNSPLCKTGIAGNDPNLGRIIAAIGSYVGKVNPEFAKSVAENCTIHVGDELVFKNGEFDLDSEKEVKLIKYLEDCQLPKAAGYPAHYKTVDITINLNPTKSSGFKTVVYGADLTDTYVEVNAGYRS